MTTAPDPGAAPIPVSAGVGLRTCHLGDFLTTAPVVPWLEIHAETFLQAGGPRLRALDRIRCDYPFSVHGVGLSLGGAEPVDPDHLDRVAALVERVRPGLVSEHLAWSVTGGVYFNDLLPLAYTEPVLAAVCRNVDQVQTRLGRRILVENPSTYLQFAASTIPEPEFLAELARRSGCGILLDVNNIHVSAVNHGWDALAYLNAVPAAAVGEIHIAGHWIEPCDDAVLLIDDHGAEVAEPVWTLLEAALERSGPRPVLVEWDTRIPALPVLLAEAAKAETRLEIARERSRRHAA
ncbi:MAG: DUF692 family protein [Azospirillum sp.]|nr:DUF692 family protein [Azospirillum sp.]